MLYRRLLGAGVSVCEEAFFPLSAIGRIECSTILLSLLIPPSLMKRVSPSPRDSA